MEQNIEINKVSENDKDLEELQFQFNFINIPWDDRPRNSKIGIISLLVSIFIVTMACVANNLVMHYKNFGSNRSINIKDASCYKVKIDDYQFIARIHSASTKELLCVGAVVSATSILANGICAQSEDIKIYLGSQKNSRCRKGFGVNLVEPVYHDGVTSKRLVLLTSFENMARCSKPISIGTSLHWNSKVNVIGRPYPIGRSLSRQYVKLVDKQFQYADLSFKYLNKENLLCVKVLAECPVQAGDLMVQNGRLFGLAATSIQRSNKNKFACFADLNIVKQKLKEFDENIDIGRVGNVYEHPVK